MSEYLTKSEIYFRSYLGFVVLDQDKVTLSTPAINLGDSAKLYSLTWQRVEL